MSKGDKSVNWFSSVSDRFVEIKRARKSSNLSEFCEREL